MSGSEPTRIELAVEGGFAALAPRTVTVDLDVLPEPTATELRTEVEDVCSAERPEIDVSGAPDVFVYRLAVTGQVTAGPVTFDDVTASPELRALVARVQELAGADECP
jgi:hypothetical protein